jgi:hypothetical protein
LMDSENFPLGLVGCGCSGTCMRAAPIGSASGAGVPIRMFSPRVFGYQTYLCLACAIDEKYGCVHDGKRKADSALTGLPDFDVTFIDSAMVNVLDGSALAEMMSSDLAQARPIVKEILQSQVRAVIGMSYANDLNAIYCESLLQDDVIGLVMFTFNWHAAKFWKPAQNMHAICSPVRIKEACNSHITGGAWTLDRT